MKTLTRLLGLSLLAVAVSSSAWAGPGWKIDRDLKLQLVYLPPSAEIENSKALKPALPNIPAHEPDITNIPYANVLKMGFPLPARNDADQLKLYLKLYRWPKSLDAGASARGVLDAFRLREIRGGEELYAFAESSRNTLIKFASIDSSERAFTKEQPFPSRVPTTQAFFDSAIPFSSIYVLPEKAIQGATDAERAKASARGVLAAHRALLDAYGRNLLKLGESEDGSRIFFAQLWRCVDQPTCLCGLRVFEVQQKPFVFDNYKDLPMPQDAKRVFLSGLLLVKLTDYAAKAPVEESQLAGKVPGQASFDGLFRPVWSQLLEVGSVYRARR